MTTKGSNNPFPSVLLNEVATDGSDTPTPAADYRRLFLGEDGALHLIDSADVVTDVSGGSGDVATDAIWDAAGDLAVGSGANTAARLALGASGTLLRSTGSAAAWYAASSLIPGWASAEVGVTDSTHFYWDGNDLAGFTTQTVSGNATWAEGQNLASVIVNTQTADDVAAVLIAQTFATSDAWILPVRVGPHSDVANNTDGNVSAGIVFTDGTTTTSNCVVGHIQVSNSVVTESTVMVGRHGTLTAVSTAPWVSKEQFRMPGWVYIKLIYQAANTFRLQFSPDGVSWTTHGEADISKTMTPTHVGLAAWNVSTAGDAICSFGPLRKV